MAMKNLAFEFEETGLYSCFGLIGPLDILYHQLVMCMRSDFV
jgi:hypothetical protein